VINFINDTRHHNKTTNQLIEQFAFLAAALAPVLNNCGIQAPAFLNHTTNIILCLESIDSGFLLAKQIRKDLIHRQFGPLINDLIKFGGVAEVARRTCNANNEEEQLQMINFEQVINFEQINI